jgi:hypothetical protein
MFYEGIDLKEDWTITHEPAKDWEVAFFISVLALPVLATPTLSQGAMGGYGQKAKDMSAFPGQNSGANALLPVI